MQPRRVLLTGGGGFVGRYLQSLLPAAFPGCSVLAPSCDVTDSASVIATIQATRPDVCIHLAAISAIPEARKHPDLAWQVNLNGALNVARALVAHAPDCLLLFPSSADVYGATFRNGEALTENALPAPLNTYSATKVAAEMALHAMQAEGLWLLRLRPFNHTGPGQLADFVVPSFARQIARVKAGRQEPMIQVGALDTYRDFLDVRDVCSAYIACIRRAEQLPRGMVFNIASGHARRIGDVLQTMIGLSGMNMWVNTDKDRLRSTEIRSATGDASLARDLLEWSPCIPFEQTLADVLADWSGRLDA